MPEIKNNFIKGKMNKDLDERIVPKGEYREAQNVALSESSDSDVGALEIIRGNEQVNSTISIAGTPETIGYCRDIKNKRIVYFITNFSGNDSESIRGITRAKGAGSNHSGSSTYANSSTDDCKIILYDVENNQTTTLVTGAFLNFSKNHLITGTQIIDDLLFWTDDYNQPRKINIARAIASSTHYQREDQISVSKYAPYTPIRLVNRNGVWADSNTTSSTVDSDKRDNSISSEYMQDKFIRFSYRYKYEDGEYSTMAPFTQIVFEPLNDGKISGQEDTINPKQSTEPKVLVDKHNIFRKGIVDSMQNAINKVPLRIPMPNSNERDNTADYTSGAYSNDYNIDAIEILIRESGGLAIKVAKTIKLSETSSSDFDYYSTKLTSGGDTYQRQVLKHVYKSEEPYQVLPEDQLTRVFDQVPIKAKSLEIVGNRVVYGNYIENYEYPLDQAGKRGIDYKLNEAIKGDTEHGASHGLLQYSHEGYKFHSLKQRRTYQVGIVFADKYGRQSPVILSSSNDDNADTITIDPNVSDKSALFSSAYSWSSNKAAFGLAMKIAFNDTTLFNSDSSMYDAEFNAGYNPHGWYSYKVVVKQTQQEYYNVYSSHPFQNWDNIDNEAVIGSSDFRGKSWLALLGDNINKVPRNINDSDINRPGIAGSDVDLYPKVVYLATGGVFGLSEQNDQLHEKADVISLGNSFEQSLFVSGDDNESGTGGFSVYDFIYSKDKNPLIAELPNMKRYFDGSSNVNGDAVVAYVNKESGTHAGASPGTAAADKVVELHNANTTGGTAAFSSDVSGYTVNGTRIKNKNKPVKVVSYNSSNKQITLDTKQELKEGDYLIFSKYHEGLSVFETEPFESKIDIFYETATCGLVQDLDEELENVSVANAPSNILFHTTSGGTTNVTSYAEATNSGTLGFVKATDNSGSSNLAFSINSVKTGNNIEVKTRFSCNSSTGEVTIVGNTAFKNTNEDNLTFFFEVSDPDSASAYAQFDVSVTNSAPTSSGNAISNISRTASAGTQVHQDSNVRNGASLTSESTNNLSATFAMGNTSYNGYFSLSLSGSVLTVSTTSSWTSTTANTFFNDSTASNRIMTVTLNDSMPSNNTSTFTITIGELADTLQVDLDIADTASMDICDAVTTQTFWVTQHTGGTAPSESGGYYTFYEGNKFFTNATLTTPASFESPGYYNSSTGQGFKYVMVRTTGDNDGDADDQGVVLSIGESDECDDRES